MKLFIFSKMLLWQRLKCTTWYED